MKRIPDYCKYSHDINLYLWKHLIDDVYYKVSSSLNNTYWDCLYDTNWVTFYSWPEKEGMVKYPWQGAGLLKCYRKLLKHCFAMYVLINTKFA